MECRLAPAPAREGTQQAAGNSLKFPSVEVCFQSRGQEQFYDEGGTMKRITVATDTIYRATTSGVGRFVNPSVRLYLKLEIGVRLVYQKW